MKLFLGTDFSEERLSFTAQIGADGVSGQPDPGSGDDGFYSVETLQNRKDLVESYGLEWMAVRMAPLEWTYRWQMGLRGADEQIENFKKTIRNMAEVGLDFIIFNMHVLRIYRTERKSPSRAGATSSSFDISLATGNPLMEHRDSKFNIDWVPEDERALGHARDGRLEHVGLAALPLVDHDEKPRVVQALPTRRLVRREGVDAALAGLVDAKALLE